MYIWVVLTTFLAMLAAYYLPIRQDTQEALTVPVAQARLMQMGVKHEAGSLYMKEKAYPYYSTAEERDVDYTNGQISDSELEKYLPYGFVNNENYVTAIYCMDEELQQIKTGEDACKKGDEAKTMRLLITYGPIPEKWQMINAEGSSYEVRPAQDMMQALRQQFGTKEMVGYAINEGGAVYIVNYEGTRFEVPRPAADNIGMAHYGIKDCLNDYGTCLAYMSWR